MAEKLIYRCIVCGTEAEGAPPRRCPRCGAPAARWRLVVDRAPAPLKPPEKPAETPAPKSPGGEGGATPSKAVEVADLALAP